MLFTALCIPLCAQKGLQVGRMFDGRFHKQKDATEVLLKGSKVKAYKLTLFRSLTINATNPAVTSIEQAVSSDGRQAIDKEQSSRGGHLGYAFFQLPSVGNIHRYLFYRNNAVLHTNSAGTKVTLIYMEGTATLKELKATFKK